MTTMELKQQGQGIRLDSAAGTMMYEEREALHSTAHLSFAPPISPGSASALLSTVTINLSMTASGPNPSSTSSRKPLRHGGVTVAKMLLTDCIFQVTERGVI